MIYGIIVAMDSEMNMLKNEMTEIEETEANGFTFVTGRIGASTVTATRCGIGKVNAAVGAITLIDNFRPDTVINTGIAGGTGNGAGILDVVIGTEVGYYDVWCGPGLPVGQVQGLPDTFACDNATFDLDKVRGRDGVKFGLIASGDKFISTPEDLRAVLAVRPTALAVDMESGAIAQVCYLRSVPFLALRVVSDTPGVPNHHEQYADFWSLAPESTFAMLHALIG